MSTTQATPPAYHISKREIKSWGNFSEENTKSRTKIGSSGKPIGFWYAYDSSWSNAHGPATHSVGEFKYRIPLGEFADDPYYPAPAKILRLNKDNFDDFLLAFHKTEFFKDPCSLLDSLVVEAAIKGDSALSLIIPEEMFEELKDKVLETMNANSDTVEIFSKGAGKDECTSFLIKLINTWTESSLATDLSYVRYYDWGAFWARVSENFAGVEFGADLIHPRQGGFIWSDIESEPVGGLSYKLHVTWLRLLDVVSGCIFHPETYFTEKPTDLQVTTGGKRRSGRSRRATRLLRAIPRRLSATRRARSRI